MNKSIISDVLKISILGFFVFVLQGVAFSEPGTAPPGGNITAPINTSLDYQRKLGDLRVRTLFTDQSSAVGGYLGIGTENPTNPLHIFDINESGHPILLESSTSIGELVIMWVRPDTSSWEVGLHTSGSGDFSITPHAYAEDRAFKVHENGDVTIYGKLNLGDIVDPRGITFTEESHVTARELSKNVKPTEKVLQFWNGEKHRMEVYVIAEDKFYTIDGTLVED